MTGGAIGSLFAQLLPSERRRAQDAAGRRRHGGMTGDFRNPLRGGPAGGRAAAVRMEAAQLRPGRDRAVLVALVCAAAAGGAGPLFPLPRRPGRHRAASRSRPASAWSRACSAALTVARCSTASRTCFSALPVHWMWWPAIGARRGGGRRAVRHARAGRRLRQHPGSARRQSGRERGPSLLVVKAVVWLVALGSGTSGGVLAPLLILGGAPDFSIGQYLPGNPGFWAMVGMAGVMSGTMRAPMTGALFAAELTNHFRPCRRRSRRRPRPTPSACWS